MTDFSTFSRPWAHSCNSVDKDLLKAYCVPDAIPDAGRLGMNKDTKASALVGSGPGCHGTVGWGAVSITHCPTSAPRAVSLLQAQTSLPSCIAVAALPRPRRLRASRGQGHAGAEPSIRPRSSDSATAFRSSSAFSYRRPLACFFRSYCNLVPLF